MIEKLAYWFQRGWLWVFGIVAAVVGVLVLLVARRKDLDQAMRATVAIAKARLEFEHVHEQSAKASTALQGLVEKRLSLEADRDARLQKLKAKMKQVGGMTDEEVDSALAERGY